MMLLVLQLLMFRSIPSTVQPEVHLQLLLIRLILLLRPMRMHCLLSTMEHRPVMPLMCQVTILAMTTSIASTFAPCAKTQLVVPSHSVKNRIKQCVTLVL
jgi:hypothetical protein